MFLMKTFLIIQLLFGCDICTSFQLLRGGQNRRDVMYTECRKQYGMERNGNNCQCNKTSSVFIEYWESWEEFHMICEDPINKHIIGK